MWQAVKVLLIGAYSVLWAGGVGSHLLVGETPPGASWTAPVFLSCAALIVFVDLERGHLTLLALGAAGWLVELAGTRLGIPFGDYSYSPVLQPQFLGVPLVMACAWVILLAYVKSSLEPFRKSRWQTAALGAVWMTGLDLVIDPVATSALGFWSWKSEGVFYGVPLSNFAGWLVASALLLAAGSRLKITGRLSRHLGGSLIVFFGLLSAAHKLVWPAAMAALLSLLHVWLQHRSRASAGA